MSTTLTSHPLDLQTISRAFGDIAEVRGNTTDAGHGMAMTGVSQSMEWPTNGGNGEDRGFPEPAIKRRSGSEKSPGASGRLRIS